LRNTRKSSILKGVGLFCIIGDYCAISSPAYRGGGLLAVYVKWSEIIRCKELIQFLRMVPDYNLIFGIYSTEKFMLKYEFYEF
jgi:hypothetical protein